MNSDKPLIIPVFIPHRGCGHQCAFCNQHSITGKKDRHISSVNVDEIISSYLSFRGIRQRVQISFYGGTFLGLDNHDILHLLNKAEKYVCAGDVDSIRFSTRPDSITPEKLDLIQDFTVQTIEVGTQSMDDSVLKKSLREHTPSDTEDAVTWLKKKGYETGVQLMTGLPGDTESKSLETCRKVISLKPDFIRIYPTLVIKGSLLAKWYEAGEYVPSSLSESITLVKKMYLLFKKNNIPVIRMGLQAEKDLDSGSVMFAGPYHPSFGHLVYSEMFYDRVKDHLEQHFPATENASKSIVVFVNNRSHSRLRGQHNENLNKLKTEFGFKKIKVKTDNELHIDEFRVE